jgi:hypothetical protein
MLNKDNQIPVTKIMTGRLISYSFPVEKPIYWGPNQVTVFPDTYNEPSGWKPNQVLSIPKVARFFFGDGGTIGGGGGGPCDGGDTGPISCWVVLSIIFPTTNPAGIHIIRRNNVDIYIFDRDRLWQDVLGGGGQIMELNSRWNLDEGEAAAFLGSDGEYTVPNDPSINSLVRCIPP